MTVRHILVVDDEPKVAFFLGKALERLSRNYRVSTANSGEEALKVLNDTFVDLLITDLRMSDISGLELIRQVQKISPQTRTILITAYGSDEVERETRHLKTHRYMTKPFGIGELTSAVKEALGGTAVSRPGLTVLSDETFEAIIQQLEELRHDIGALCIFLADMQGQRLAEVGDTRGIDAATLLALLAGGFATSGELARQFGNGQALNLNHHEGSRYGIYSSNVGEELFLAIIYEQRSQTSRIGIVWFYTRNTVEALLSTLSTAEAASPDQSISADFGASLTAELDTLFTEDPFPSPDATGKAGEPPADLPPQEIQEIDESDQELIDLETAIERGLLSADFGQEPKE